MLPSLPKIEDEEEKYEDAVIYKIDASRRGTLPGSHVPIEIIGFEQIHIMFRDRTTTRNIDTIEFFENKERKVGYELRPHSINFWFIEETRNFPKRTHTIDLPKLMRVTFKKPITEEDIYGPI
jgi:hypothetical protein